VPDLEQVAAKVEAMGRRALVVPADVRDDRSVHVMVETTLETFGRLDVLVNNAGLGHFGPIEELTLEQFDEMLGDNLRGPFLCIRAVVPAMKRQGSGAILNIASVAGLVANPNLAGYNATKFGLMGLSEACMLELRHAGIRVSTICPGSTATDFAGGRDPANRLSVDDVAQAALAVLTAGPHALISQVHLRPLHPPRR
jgi:3-oxoacyl-[acyl-carrier protein] reductase